MQGARCGYSIGQRKPASERDRSSWCVNNAVLELLSEISAIIDRITVRVAERTTLVPSCGPLIEHSPHDGSSPGRRVPVDDAAFESVHAALAVGEADFVGSGVAEEASASFGAGGVPFVADGSADEVGLVEAPVDGAALELLAAADAVGVDDFVGGGVLEDAAFPAVACPCGEEVVEDGVCAGGCGPVDGSVDECLPAAVDVGVDEFVGGGEAEEAEGAAEGVVLDAGSVRRPGIARRASSGGSPRGRRRRCRGEPCAVSRRWLRRSRRGRRRLW